MCKGFFTQGISYALPHPGIPERTILLICKVIRRAWQILEENPPCGFVFPSEKEDPITLELAGVIENRLRKYGEIDGFNAILFGRVVRGSEISNYNKEHPDKRPDIFFDLNRVTMPVLNDQDGLFVECKPIDKNHKLATHYVKKGIIRFVNGDYAWAMQEALMVGYCAPAFSFADLEATLDKKSTSFLNTVTHGHTAEATLYRSTHQRKFNWLENSGKACPITISHLWLTLPSVQSPL